MADLTVSGAGTGAVNGDYNQVGTTNGRPDYSNGGGITIFWDASLFWTIYSFSYLYYSYDDVATPDLVTTWAVSAGSPPVPTVTAGGGAVAPTVTTGSASSITTTTATLPGNVTADGGATVTERGCVVSTSSNPTTSDTKFTSGSGTGSFNANASGLAPNTLYHFRAYAINSAGTSYGSDQTFTTNSVPDTSKFFNFF
jgi:hypothetical protein